MRAIAAAVGLLVLLARAAGAQPATERRVALVVGNGAYQHADPLPNPPNDARAMAELLRRLGFEVVEGADLDRAGMEKAQVSFADKAEAADVALAFYAGHGVQVDGRNYLLPVDAQLEKRTDLRQLVGADALVEDAAAPSGCRW
jgi:uncharacterized caspase-like protein